MTQQTTPPQQMPNDVKQAYGYFLKGLTANEISKLMDISQRTFHRMKKAYNFKTLATIPETPTDTIQQRAVKLVNAGLSYAETGKRLNRCKATIYNYVRSEKATHTQTIPEIYQSLFDYMTTNHNVILLQSELNEIVRLSNEIQKSKIEY